MELLSLPVVMVERILLYLSYDEIAKNRIICKDFDAICQRLLNRGFVMIEKRLATSLKAVKTQLPRRESERRYHPLSKHCDILTSAETRISMLSMTYTKFINHGICCFIPGKVIDEIEKVLHIVHNSSSLPRSHEVLQELRDISSMAIEHFDDKVSPALRKKLHEDAAVIASSTDINAPGSSLLGVTGLLGSGSPVPSDIQATFYTQFAVIKQRSALNWRYTSQLTTLCHMLAKKLRTYKRIMDTQARQLREVNSWKADHDQTIADLKQHIEECKMNCSELTHKAVSKTPMERAAQAVAYIQQELKDASAQIKLDKSTLPTSSAHRSTIAELKQRIEECKSNYMELARQSASMAPIERAIETITFSQQAVKDVISEINLVLSTLPVGSTKQNTPAESERHIEERNVTSSEVTNQSVPNTSMERAAHPVASVQQELKDASSQIKLDLSNLPIGSAKQNTPGSNIRPRKTYSTSPPADGFGDTFSLFDELVRILQQTKDFSTASIIARSLSQLPKRSISECSSSSYGDSLGLKFGGSTVTAKRPKLDTDASAAEDGKL